MANKKKFSIIILLIIIVNLIVYSQLRNADFITLDDGIYLTDNIHVQGGLTKKNIVWAFTTMYAEFWHPMTWLSNMFVSEFFGMYAGAHHMANLIIHILNCILLFICLYSFTGTLWRSGFVALLFAIHPLHVEPVAWLSSRKDLLSTFFLFLALIYYEGYVNKGDIKKYVLMIIMFILGLMAKPMLVTFPCMLLLLDFWPLKRIDINQLDKFSDFFRSDKGMLRLFVEKIPVFILSMIFFVITLIAQNKTSTKVIDETQMIFQACNAIVSYSSYLCKTFWPFNLSLYYTYPAYLHIGKVLLSLLTLCVLTYICIKRIKKQQWWVSGWLWYLITLFPVIGFVKVGSQSMADRYTYIPLIGVFIIISWSVYELINRYFKENGNNIFIIFASVITFILVIISYRQAAFWKNSISIYEHAIKNDANNYFAHVNLGDLMYEMGNTDEAIANYEKALKIKPNFASIHNNLGYVYFKLNKPEEAIVHFKNSLKYKANNAETLFNMGASLAMIGEVEDSVRYYNKALLVEPEMSKAHFNIANCYKQLNDIVNAERHYLETFRTDSQHEKALFNLGNLYYSEKRIKEAEIFYKKCIDINKDNSEVYNNLGYLYERSGRPEEASIQYQAAIRINPENTNVHNNLGNVYLRTGAYLRAVEQYKRVLEINPEHSDAKYNLEMLLDGINRMNRIKNDRNASK